MPGALAEHRSRRLGSGGERRRALGAELRAGGFAVPQLGQAAASGVAHSVQNFAPARFSVPQFGQITCARASG